ncbi:hypothetical protein KVT40_005704 [Elsinoe batatas]|uniref:Uncharacterized protein n=1 Tax=Elsinoe batatas TaxID=2601811 RepID=A0A8K0PIL5_9PEZI|nr:hypothetical protein KVT40_005704 [Elsinoe batatas]
MSTFPTGKPVFVCTKPLRFRIPEQSDEIDPQDAGHLLCDRILYCYIDEATDEPTCFFLGKTLFSSDGKLSEMADDEPHPYRDDLDRKLRAQLSNDLPPKQHTLIDDFFLWDRDYPAWAALKKKEKEEKEASKAAKTRITTIPTTESLTEPTSILPETQYTQQWAEPSAYDFSEPTQAVTEPAIAHPDTAPPSNVIMYLLTSLYSSLITLATFFSHLYATILSTISLLYHATLSLLWLPYMSLRGYLTALLNIYSLLWSLLYLTALLTILYLLTDTFRTTIYEKLYPSTIRPIPPPLVPHPNADNVFHFPVWQHLWDAAITYLGATDYAFDIDAVNRDRPSTLRSIYCGCAGLVASFFAGAAYARSSVRSEATINRQQSRGGYVVQAEANRDMLVTIARAGWERAGWPSWWATMYYLCWVINLVEPVGDGLAWVWHKVMLPVRAWRAFSFRRHVLRKSTLMGLAAVVAVFSTWMAATGGRQVREWWEDYTASFERGFRLEHEVEGYGGWLPRWVGAGPTVTVHRTSLVPVTETEMGQVRMSTRWETVSVTVVKTGEVKTRVMTEEKTKTETETETEVVMRTVKVYCPYHTGVVVVNETVADGNATAMGEQGERRFVVGGGKQYCKECKQIHCCEHSMH